MKTLFTDTVWFDLQLSSVIYTQERASNIMYNESCCLLLWLPVLFVPTVGWLSVWRRNKITGGICSNLKNKTVLWLNGCICSLFLSQLSSYIWYHYQHAKIADFFKLRALSRLWSLNIPLNTYFCLSAPFSKRTRVSVGFVLRVNSLFALSLGISTILFFMNYTQ